jgi:hypothetical protein
VLDAPADRVGLGEGQLGRGLHVHGDAIARADATRATPPQTISELATSARDSTPSAMRAYVCPTTPAVIFASASTAFVATPACAARMLRRVCGSGAVACDMRGT